MVKLGKIIFKKLESSDLDKLKIFCADCEKLGYFNNSNFTNIKLDQMRMPHGQFFVGIDTEKDIIFSLAGVHQLSEINQHAWRCLFRGAQLPRYTPIWSMDIFKSVLHLNQFLYMQIKFVQEIDPNAEFYLSTNINANSGSKSSRMNEKIMPRIVKQGICELFLENFMLYNVPQNLWKINVPKYMQIRDCWLIDENYKH